MLLKDRTIHNLRGRVFELENQLSEVKQAIIRYTFFIRTF